MAQPAENRATNGSARTRMLAGAGGLAVPYDDPLARVFGLGAQTSGPAAWLVYFVGAIALLLGLAASARAIERLRAMSDREHPALSLPQEIDVLREEPPPPAPPPAAEAPAPEAKPEPLPPAAPRAVPKDVPPPSPAQAAKVLTQEPDPNEPVDLTGNTIVTGNAEAYAGGVTASNGTSRTAVRGLTSPTGAPQASAAPRVAPAGPDRSRPASLAGGAEWTDCPFPPEADMAQIDEAYVTIEVDVRADGTAAALRVVDDPGHGFARETVRFAKTKAFSPALDHDGNPIASTRRFRVHFSR